MIEPSLEVANRCARRRAAGFTLLEVMIAFGVLAFGIRGVTAALLAAINSSKGSSDRTEAMHLARQQMEIFRAMAANDVIAMASGNDPLNPIDPDPGDATLASYNRSWTISPDTPEVGMISLNVQVNWVDGVGFARSTTVQSLKADM